MKMFSNDSDFCFDIPIYEILVQKSLNSQKKFVPVEELFAYIFGIYKKFGGNNPSILAPSDSVAVAT